jgi:multidrug efflux pump subunit AcrB
VVERELRTIPGIGNVTSSASLVRPELVVRPTSPRRRPRRHLRRHRRHAAHRHRRRLRQGLAKLNLAQRQVPIVVKLPAEARQDLALLASCAYPARMARCRWATSPTLSLDSGPAQIDRYDRQRNINFEIELNRQPLGEVEKAALALPSLQQLPAGVIQTTVGDAEVMGELFASFGLAMLTGVLCIYIVLVLLFKRLHAAGDHPGRAAAVGTGGAFVALLVTHSASPCRR